LTQTTILDGRLGGWITGSKAKESRRFNYRLFEFRQRKKRLAFCQSVFGSVGPSISQALASDTL
jgi:hypothetical protein